MRFDFFFLKKKNHFQTDTNSPSHPDNGRAFGAKRAGAALSSPRLRLHAVRRIAPPGFRLLYSRNPGLQGLQQCPTLHAEGRLHPTFLTLFPVTSAHSVALTASSDSVSHPLTTHREFLPRLAVSVALRAGLSPALYLSGLLRPSQGLALYLHREFLQQSRLYLPRPQRGPPCLVRRAAVPVVKSLIKFDQGGVISTLQGALHVL